MYKEVFKPLSGLPLTFIQKINIIHMLFTNIIKDQENNQQKINTNEKITCLDST